MKANPPPLLSSSYNRFRQLARASWMSVVIACGANLLLQAANNNAAAHGSRMIGAALAGLLALVGIASGITALFGIHRHGRKGLLWPAITGVCLWLLLFGLALPTLFRTRRLAAIPNPTSLLPAIHSPTAMRIQDDTIGFSFDLPDGYEPFAPSAKPSEYSHAFFRQVPNEPTRVLLVKPLGGTLAPQRLRPEDLPPGGSVSLTAFNWRGLKVDGVRVVEQIGDTGCMSLEANRMLLVKPPSGTLPPQGVRPEDLPPGESISLTAFKRSGLKVNQAREVEQIGDTGYVTFNVQIPLRTQAVQIGFGGATAVESQIRTLAEQIVSTMDGETNWQALSSIHEKR